MKAVIYRFQEYHKINGSLYYAIEYYLYLRKYIDIKLFIVDGKNHTKLLNEVWYDKYSCPPKYETPSRIDLLRYKDALEKVLMIDIKSHNELHDFLHCNIVQFVNENVVKKFNNAKYFGSYSYQNYDYFSYLKLGCEFHNTFKQGDKIFISSAAIKKVNLSNYQSDKYIIKSSNINYNNLFNEIYKVIYHHEQLDTNNRIIIESVYHNKELEIIFNCLIKDSISLRKHDLDNNNIAKYLINDECPMIKEMIK